MNETYIDREILSLCPVAPGWCAVYTEDDGSETVVPLAFWAMVKLTRRECANGRMVPHDIPDTAVEGVDPAGEGWTQETCPDTSNFKAYRFDPAAWLPNAEPGP